MGSFRLTLRELGTIALLLLAVVALAGLGYGGVQAASLVRDLQHAKFLDNHRTANDRVIDYSEEMYIALERYRRDNDGKITRDLNQLVEAGYIREIPINPFTGQSTRLIRIGEYPNAGELSMIVGNDYIFNEQTKQTETRELLSIFCFGEPEGGLFKHEEDYDQWKQRARPDASAYRHASYEYEWMSDELADTVLWFDGGICVICSKMSYPYSWSADSPEETFRKNGYTLPIQMETEQSVVAEGR